MKQIRVTTDQIKCPEIDLDAIKFEDIIITINGSQLHLNWYVADVIFRHMRKYYEVADLKQVLDEMTDEEKEEISELTENPEQYIDDILDRYHNYQESHETWNSDMRNAIDYVMR